MGSNGIDSFLDKMKTLDNVIGFHINGNSNGVVFQDNALLRKPIGIASKSYGFLEQMLYANIGSHQFEFDGYGTIVGMNANPYLNNETNPWFLLDEERKKYSDYLKYVNATYFHGTMMPPNFHLNSDKLKLNDYNALLEENARVGAIHHFDLDTVLNARLLVPNGATNPNGYNDTRLGVINNFYLSSALADSYSKTFKRETSSYHNPSFGNEENVMKESFSITQGAYHKFGLTGKYGIENNTYQSKKGLVMPQSLLTDDIITWSTVDNPYGGQNSFSPFGLLNKPSYSLGLITASGGKMQDFIAKSMLGIDLMDEKDYSSYLYNSSINDIQRISKKKYFALPYQGDDYATRISNFVNYENFINEKDDHWELIRYKFMNPGNDNFRSYNTFLTYVENDGDLTIGMLPSRNANEGIAVGTFLPYHRGRDFSKNDIIQYTNYQFDHGKYGTLIARFHTDVVEYDNMSSAVSQYGMSHGRNLLKKDHKGKRTNGYSDPYCRVWTYHKQYAKYRDLIRPFVGDDYDALNRRLTDSFQPNRSHLIDNGVKNRIGLINFTLQKDKENNVYKNCMFSIENLAWRGDNFISQYEKGPNGGRIMWFPPYGLTFNENVSTTWNANQFIGRGEKIYTYVDTERSGTLSFQLLIDHPSILNLVNGVTDTKNEVDDVDSVEQQILRFFAGCDVLGEDKKVEEIVEEPEEEIIEEVVAPPTSINETKIVFEVFFPNNQSGKDWTVLSDFIIYMTKGAGIFYPVNDGDFYVSQIAEDGTYNKTDMIGGYEQYNALGCGLSVIKEWDGGNANSVLTTVYKVQTDGNIIPVELMTEKCENAEKKNNYWGYRVDRAYKTQILETNNYIDKCSYQLNCTPYQSEDETIVGCSFNDMVKYFGGCKEGQKFDQNKVDSINGILTTYEVEKVILYGYSSSHGKSEYNDTLTSNRIATIKKWLKENNNKLKNCTYEEKNELAVEMGDTDINTKEAKQARKVKVEIIIKKDEVVSSSEPTDNVDETITTTTTPTNTSSVTTSNTQNSESGSEDASVENSQSKKVYNEYDFFSYVNNENTILRNKIVNKIKYFDPAYHSITPEGFNNRLTFLHQCTRQGATHSASDTEGRNVRNLSFGAPPICVLRIGDFYNTKIIIDSLTISYDDNLWDLNDEGIGVMPMIAKVDIGFKFIGGSDLSGPISRLQNAVSFNYYANTKVYDNNADTNNPLMGNNNS